MVKLFEKAMSCFITGVWYFYMSVHLYKYGYVGAFFGAFFGAFLSGLTVTGSLYGSFVYVFKNLGILISIWVLLVFLGLKFKRVENFMTGISKKFKAKHPEKKHFSKM